jgi:transposase
MEGKLKIINQHAAGIDIGAEKIFVCANDEGFRSFYTFTDDLHAAAAYLKEHGVTSVAMEATGVYWLPVKDILAGHGLNVVVVRAGDAKQLPGRNKTDGEDCQWIRKLHQYGLLRPSLTVETDISELRLYVRSRNDHIGMAAQHVQHMQKALTLMNIRLHQVISQIQGASGLRIIKAILQGERDPMTLVNLCDTQILNRKKLEVIKSLQGNYKTEYLFSLEQAYTAWTFYNQLIVQCDKKIEEWLEKNITDKNVPQKQRKIKPIRHHKPNINGFNDKMLILTDGKDPSQLPGLTDYTVMQIIAETGLDYTKWKSKKHFVSWLKLTPIKNQSGKIRKNYRSHQHTYAGQIFREAANSLLRSKHIGLGSFARRLRSRKGPQIAIKATARKIAEMFYETMTKGLQYVEKGIILYENKIKETQLLKLKKMAQTLGVTIEENRVVH